MHGRLFGRAQRLDGQDGMTLVELIVAMSILMIAMLILLPTLLSVQNAAVNESTRSRTLDQARLAMQSIDRQVRSGNLLYPPSGSGYTFLIYTQAYSAQDDTSRCGMWTINSQQQLMYGYWAPLTPAGFTVSWQVVAEGVMNKVKSQSAFSLDATGRTMTVLFLINTDPSNPQNANATRQLQTSVTGRDTSFGFPVSVCGNLPSNVPT